LCATVGSLLWRECATSYCGASHRLFCLRHGISCP
jgi:hypothetical protein